MKQQVRVEKKKERSLLSQQEVLARSALIRKRLEQLPVYKRARTVLFYVSMEKEVYTHQLIRNAFTQKRVLVPVVKDIPVLAQIQSWEQLQVGKGNILQPTNPVPFDPAHVDLILVPGIAFDKKGNRLGYGMGYYDRLLSTTKAYKLALAFESQLVKHLPVEDHDQRVESIITEEQHLVCH